MIRVGSILVAWALAGGGALRDESSSSRDPEVARLEQDLEQDPENVQAMWNLAYVLFHRDELDRAEALFVQSEQVGGPHWYPRFMRGGIAEKQFRFRAALVLYRASEELVEETDEPARSRERVESIIADLVRFRHAKERVDEALVWTLGLIGLVVAAGAYGVSRLRST